MTLTETDVRAEVVSAALRMEADGLVVGTAGNVSGRQPNGTVCLTPSSTAYRDISPEGLAVVSVDGEHLAGSGKPSTEKAMHLALLPRAPRSGRRRALPPGARVDVRRLAPADTGSDRRGHRLRRR